MKIQEINYSGYYDVVLRSEKPVFVSFGADWCGPCKNLEIILTRLQEELSEHILVFKVNIDKEQELVQENLVSSVPHTILSQSGNTRESLVGVHSYDTFFELAQKYIPEESEILA